ncbi:hypothetical protein FQZ97_893210 [compost metagenome]
MRMMSPIAGPSKAAAMDSEAQVMKPTASRTPVTMVLKEVTTALASFAAASAVAGSFRVLVSSASSGKSSAATFCPTLPAIRPRVSKSWLNCFAAAIVSSLRIRPKFSASVARSAMPFPPSRRRGIRAVVSLAIASR